MTMWHTYVAHMAKYMNMVRAFFGGGPWTRAPPLNHVLVLHISIWEAWFFV